MKKGLGMMKLRFSTGSRTSNVKSVRKFIIVESIISMFLNGPSRKSSRRSEKKKNKRKKENNNKPKVSNFQLMKV